MTSILGKRLLMASIIAITVGAATVAQAVQLVNADFDTTTFVGLFGDVVVPFSPGFWGAENSVIVTTGSGPGGTVTPLSSPQMLEMTDEGLVVTQAWQIVHVAPVLTRRVGISGMFTASGTSAGAVGSVRITTFAQGSSWPTSSGSFAASLPLDAAGGTWEPISLAPLVVPPLTEWILAEVNFVNSTLAAAGSPHGWVDNVLLTIPEPASLSLIGLGLAPALLRRRRR